MRSFQLAHVEVRVNGGGFQFGMAQHDLDMPQVAAVLQQDGGKCVSEHVATARLADSRIGNEIVNMRGQPARMHALTFLAQKEGGGIRDFAKLRPGVNQVFLYPTEGPSPDRHVAVFSAFALLNDSARRRIEGNALLIQPLLVLTPPLFLAT